MEKNLVLIDTVMLNSRVMFRKNLTHAVLHPACSIFDKKLLFIAGGLRDGEWTSDIQIFDIEKCEIVSKPDKNL